MDRVIVWLDILVGWIQVDLFFMQVQKSHMKPIFSLSWVELMSLGLICLVIVNYCHSSSYSQLNFFFFFFRFMFLVHFIPGAIILPFLSHHQGINPFTRMGSICCEKKKKEQKETICIGWLTLFNFHFYMYP